MPESPEPLDASHRPADLDVVDLLARATLEARRRLDRLEVLLNEELRDLVELCGLEDVIAAPPRAGDGREPGENEPPAGS